MAKLGYRLLVLLSLLSILLAGSAAPVSAAPWQSKVDPWVLETAAGGETEFLVYLTTQADLSAAQALPTKLEKGTYVYQTLFGTAQRTQGALLAELERLGLEYRPYWITNMVWVRGDLNAVQVLAQRLDVAHVYANPSVKLDAPQVYTSPEAAPEAIEWNIIKVNADDVWALGFTGQGVVIGGQDTGYQWDHPALKNQYRGWDGASADHDYNWHDAIHSGSGNDCGYNSPFPCDDYGHGTHTMGTMVGDDGGSNQIGMAPGARWIGCRNMDNGNGTPATYAECYEWFVAPYPLGGDPSQGDPAMAPDVINNSWGCPPSEGCTDPTVLLEATENLVAAGIVSAHSAGNSGSGCSSIDTPSAIYDVSFTVGATDSSDTIAGFSSRGPVTVDGSNRPKPDISAPGVSIRSSVPGGGYEGGWSGTSMAGPHVAGEVALLISAHPGLRGQVADIEYTITQTALGRTTNQGCGGDLPNEIPNNVYGWGRIDVLAAVQYTHQLELDKTTSSLSILPGENITYTLSVAHTTGIGATTNVVLTDTLPVGTSFVSATPPYTLVGDTILWSFPSLEVPGTVNVDLVVNVDIAAFGTITNDDYVVRSDQVPPLYGNPVVTQVEKQDFLALSKVTSVPFAGPGDLVTYTLTLTNTHALIDTTHAVVTDTLPLGSTFVSATGDYTLIGDTVRWDIPNLEPMSTWNEHLVVLVDSDHTGELRNEDYAAYSDQALPVNGAPVVTPLPLRLYLPFVLRIP